MKKLKKYISFFETKKYEIKNEKFEANTRYRIHTETDDFYIIKNGIEVSKDGEGKDYITGEIVDYAY